MSHGDKLFGNVKCELSFKMTLGIQWIVMCYTLCNIKLNPNSGLYDRNSSKVYTKKNKVNIKDEIWFSLMFFVTITCVRRLDIPQK